MKTKFILALVTLLTLLCTLGKSQDVNTNAPPVPVSTTGFFDTATKYFTSFNTNADMGWAQRGEASAGIVSLQGPVNLANDLHFGYELKGNFGIESSTRSTGIAGTWLSQQVGPNYSFKVYDAKLTFFGNAGYNFYELDHRYYGEIGVRVSKKLTRFTFAGVSFAEQVPTGRQVYSAFAGFNF